MKHCAARLRYLVLGMALSAIILYTIATTPTTPTYSLAQIEQGLLHDPAAWAGRTLTIRARSDGWGADGCPGTPLGDVPPTPLGCRLVTLEVISTDTAPQAVLLSIVVPQGMNAPRLASDPLAGLALPLQHLPVVGDALFTAIEEHHYRVRLLHPSQVCINEPGCVVAVHV